MYGEGGIRTLDGGIHPHNALAGRRLQPLGHFSAVARRIADALLAQLPRRGEETVVDKAKMSVPAPPSYPGIETRLRLTEAGFPLFGAASGPPQKIRV